MAFGSGNRHDIFDCLARVAVGSMVDSSEVHPSRRSGAIDRARELLQQLAQEFAEPLPPFKLVNRFVVEEAAEMVRKAAQDITDSLNGSLVVAQWQEDGDILVAVVGDEPGREVRTQLAKVFRIGVRSHSIPDEHLLMLYHSRPAAQSAGSGTSAVA